MRVPLKPLFALSCLLLVLAAIANVHNPFGSPGDSIQTYVPDTGQPTIVCLGDSLTAGFGAPVNQSYPAWLQRRLTSESFNYRVVNAGVSGDRVADGLRRLQTDVLRFQPQVLIVALGSNDPGHTLPAVWARQLGDIVVRAQAHGAKVVVGGLDEPGMGDIYRRLAAQYQVPLVWFMARVAALPGDWSGAHHPNGAGYRVVADSFWPVLTKLLSHR